MVTFSLLFANPGKPPVREHESERPLIGSEYPSTLIQLRACIHLTSLSLISTTN